MKCSILGGRVCMGFFYPKELVGKQLLAHDCQYPTCDQRLPLLS